MNTRISVASITFAVMLFLTTGCGQASPEVKASYAKSCRSRLERTFPGAEVISYSSQVYDIPLTAYCQSVVKYQGKMYNLSYQTEAWNVDIEPLEVKE